MHRSPSKWQSLPQRLKEVANRRGFDIESVSMVPMQYFEEKITSEDIRDALAKMVSKKLFWGKGAMKKMDITVVMCVCLFESQDNLWNCYYCQWETFSEKRDSTWKSHPFTRRAVAQNRMLNNRSMARRTDLRPSPGTSSFLLRRCSRTKLSKCRCLTRSMWIVVRSASVEVTCSVRAVMAVDRTSALSAMGLAPEIDRMEDGNPAHHATEVVVINAIPATELEWCAVGSVKEKDKSSITLK